MSDRLTCPNTECGKSLAPTTNGKYRQHLMPASKIPCDFGGTVIPKEDECRSESISTGVPSPTATSAAPPQDDVKERAEHATSSTPSSPSPPEEADAASTTAPADPALPGVTEYAATLDGLAATQLADYRARVEANLTPFSQPAPVDEVEQPVLFSQPAGRASEQPAAPMTDLGRELTARLKEMFYAYDNRRTSDNRSAQATMGPSEMGTPCDRRLALSLMRMPPVNPGGDGWAAFVGTCIHAGLAEMFLWANAGTGRFAVETPLTFDSDIVPKGTADLIDRTLFMLDDHKCQGRWSRNKLRSQGPSPTYRVQAHVYAHGARQRGEKIEHIAIISWPRDEATLDDLYVFTEPYNPAIVQEAFARVERIAGEVVEKQAELVETYGVPAKEERQLLQIKARVGADYDVVDDCRFCPFYLPNARSITMGCNGKR
ncbi:hypothetical protein ACFY7C_19155 [Streptomyces sp. NPDC012769]|uniref:hypothetical protein n=1 Tax=Streptomyces sp. NPDC012769 TaxID=3364848 RepID=UPI0036B1A3CA